MDELEPATFAVLCRLLAFLFLLPGLSVNGENECKTEEKYARAHVFTS